jgi:hypothetical protein
MFFWWTSSSETAVSGKVTPPFFQVLELKVFGLIFKKVPLFFGEPPSSHASYLVTRPCLLTCGFLVIFSHLFFLMFSSCSFNIFNWMYCPPTFHLDAISCILPLFKLLQLAPHLQRKSGSHMCVSFACLLGVQQYGEQIGAMILFNSIGTGAT